MLVIKGSQCKDFNEALNKEWLESNYFNAVSYNSILNISAKKSHILFKTDQNLVNNLIEEIEINEKKHQLNFFNIDIKDDKLKDKQLFLEKFYIDLCPTFIYNFFGVKLKKEIILSRDKNILIIKYEIISELTENSKISLSIKPLIYNNDLIKLPINTRLINKPNYIRYIFNNNKNIYFYYSGESFKIIDEYVKDIFNNNIHLPGYFEVNLKKNASYLIISDFRINNLDFEKLYKNEINNRKNFITSLSISYELLKNAVLSSQFYIKKRENNLIEIIRSFPEDKFLYNITLLSLPGLLLPTKRYEEYKLILLNLKKNIKDGIIPEFNTIENYDYKNSYNSLFYIYAVFKYIQYSGDWKFIKDNIWELLINIFEKYASSNIKGIESDTDELLKIKEEYSKTDYKSWFKLRAGKDLLLNILWYNSVKIIELFSAKYSHISLNSRTGDLSYIIRKNLYKKFWNKKGYYLNNGVEIFPSNDIDTSFRPYQIFALSFPFNDLLYFEQKRHILNQIKEKLLTPVGLRTLSPENSKFSNEFNEEEFDTYYNGINHPFLLMHYISGYRETYNKSKTARKDAKYLLSLFEKNIKIKSIGHFPEAFTALPPYENIESPMFVLSLAEYLRVKYEI